MSDRARARNIVRRLADIGAVTGAVPTERMIDEVEVMTHGDYIPGGGRATSATNLREAPAGHRCGLRTGYDPQSGPIYCGGVATLIGDTPDGVVATCARHERDLRRIAGGARTYGRRPVP